MQDIPAVITFSAHPQQLQTHNKAKVRTQLLPLWRRRKPAQGSGAQLVLGMHTYYMHAVYTMHTFIHQKHLRKPSHKLGTTFGRHIINVSSISMNNKH
jgi:hypothetical protein